MRGKFLDFFGATSIIKDELYCMRLLLGGGLVGCRLKELRMVEGDEGEDYGLYRCPILVERTRYY